MSKRLLIEEMKRSIEIMESKDEIKRHTFINEGRFGYNQTDKDVIELFQLFKLIRRHTGKIEKESFE
jgi:hypothetical protein